MSARYREIKQGFDRHFEIMLGMREGYGDQRHIPEHTLDDVLAAHHAWQASHGVVQGIALAPCTLSYGWPEAGSIHGASEPACQVTGAINVLYDAHMAGDEAMERVLSLAEFLAQALGQTRVYVRFLGLQVILHRDEGATPTGD